MFDNDPGPLERGRLARALGDYWYSGIGPTHDEIDKVLDRLDMPADPDLSKREKVNATIEQAPDLLLPKLVAEFVVLLGDRGHLNPSDQRFALLQKALLPYNLNIINGRVAGGVGIGVDPEQLPLLPVAREHVQRIQRAIRDEDDPQLLGSAKELLESVSRLVVASIGEPPPLQFPALFSRALEILRLDPKAPATRDDLLEPVRRILGSAKQIAMSVNELRNAYGTGHGRSEVTVRLERRHARLAAGSAVVVATLMLDTFEDPQAPWRGSEK